MITTDDYSYVNMLLVDHSFAVAFPYAIRLDRHFTEEQKEENLSFAETFGTDSKEWKEACERIRASVAADNLTAIEALLKEFRIGQYYGSQYDKRVYNNEFAFWFWCNVLENTVRDGRTGRDYSYVTLSMDDHICTYPDSKEVIWDRCRQILEALPTTHNQAIFQYKTQYKNATIKGAAYEIYNKIKGQFVNYYGSPYKLEMLDGHGSNAYVFKRKFAKGTNGQAIISDVELVSWGIQNGLI